MPQGSFSRERLVLEHAGWLKPEDYWVFIHLDGFTADWHELRLSDEDLRILQLAIMVNPQAAPVIAGTGGVRKLRFAPPSWRRGKSGALRVLYAIFPDYSVSVLAAAYQKPEKEDITPGEKRMLKRILTEIRDELAADRGDRKR